MELFDTLKQFKSIEPDPQFVERSKRMIFAAPQEREVKASGILIFLRVLESGAVMALAGFFLLVVTGSFSTNSIAPIPSSVIDPRGLHAEAQAIDMQIQLANLDYPTVTSKANPGSTTPTVIKKAIGAALAPQETTAATAVSTPATAAGDATSTATSTPVSIDQSLQQLSQ